MKKGWKKQDNRGSSLILVMITIAFIGILGALILSVTMTNIQMKAVDMQARKNFYSADAVLDELKAGLEEISAKAMQDAYSYVLLNYATISNDPSKNIKDTFDELYLNGLMNELSDGSRYKADTLRSYLSTENRGALANKDDLADIAKYPNKITKNLSLTNPKERRYVKLEGIQIRYNNFTTGYETSISTDIVLESPDINFAGSGTYPEYSGYAMVADLKITTGLLNSNSFVNGNIYAGEEGIIATTNHLNLENGIITTRGDVTVENGAILSIGRSSTSTIWAENITTHNNPLKSGEAKLDIYGDCYVSDDLMLNAKNSNVTIGGNYYGYNFNKNNTKIITHEQLTNLVKAEYSSAIMINGEKSSLDMQAIHNLYVAGRTFVSSSKAMSSNDIMMGQSIAIKSHQTAYLVPSKYIKQQHNPLLIDEIVGDAKDQVDFTGAPTSLTNLLTSDKFTTFYYSSNGIQAVYYYLDFKDQKSANEYFRNYYQVNENASILDENASPYINPSGKGIKLSSDTYIPSALVGGIMLQVHNDPLTAKSKSSIVGSSIISPDQPSDAILNDCIRKALEYKARQLTLRPSTALAASDIRLLDKTSQRLFQSIVTHQVEAGTLVCLIHKEANSENATSHGFDSNKVKEVRIDLNNDRSSDASVYIVDNDGVGDSSFELDSIITKGGKTRGIVIATGDIIANVDYEGLLISGGTIQIEGSTKIQSDSNLVQELIRYGIKHADGSYGKNQFLHYLSEYANNMGTISSIDQVDIASQIYYENWKKN